MFFLFILVIFTILIIAIHTSKIGIDIKNLIIDTDAEEKINEDGKEELIDETEISTDYLTDTDLIEIKKGIKVVGLEELNKLLEDYE